MEARATYLAERLGSVELSPTGTFEAGSYESFTLTFTTGEFGADESGSIKILMRLASDLGRPQFDDPKASNYVTVETSADVNLECSYDAYASTRPWTKTLHIKVLGGHLSPGDTVTTRFGDTRGGSPGWRLQTFCEEKFEFRVTIDAFSTHEWAVLPDSPTIEIVPGPAHSWKAVLPTQRRAGETFRLGLKAEDAMGNPTDQADQTLILVASAPIAGLPETVMMRPGEKVQVIEGLSISEPGTITVQIRDTKGLPLADSNPLRIAQEAPLIAYWGDLHAQSNETVGTNTARQYFEFGRDYAFLDVCSHQANDFQIPQNFWEELNRITAEFNDPGRFITFPGYEWSGNPAVGGDRNVYFREEGRPIRRCSHVLVDDLSDVDLDTPTANDLFASLIAAKEDVVCYAHCGGRPADIKYAHDGRVEHSVEVHSGHGSFEWILNDAFEMGYRVGVVCNSDGHRGRIGAYYPGASHFVTGGLTCFLLPELTRDAVFEGIRHRHHYGTTGTRLFLDVAANFASPATIFGDDPALGPATGQSGQKAIMGDIVRSNEDSVELVVDVVGAVELERVEIRNGLEVLETIRPYSADDLGTRIRIVWQGAEHRGRRRHTPWDGDAHFTGNKILRAQAINFWNPYRALEMRGEDGLAWQSFTPGSLAGFDAWLGDAANGTLVLHTPHLECDIPIQDIGFEPKVFDCGGLDRRVTIQRLPDELPTSEMRIKRHIDLRESGDNPLYVCVTQEDGHQAWSSPIYIFR
jgi:hypothetical protein